MSPANSDRSWLREFSTEIRWTVVVVVLAALAIVALWPRDSGPDNAATPNAQPPGRAEPSAAELAALRDQAQLDLCATESAAPPVPQRFDGASGTCLATGAPIELTQALAGRTTLINVWATWCPPCRRELPALQAYAERPDSVRVLGVQVKSGQAAGLELLDELGVHFPSIHDTQRELAAALRVPNALPASYVVTPDGTVQRLKPEVFETADEVEAAVQQVLRPAP